MQKIQVEGTHSLREAITKCHIALSVKQFLIPVYDKHRKVV